MSTGLAKIDEEESTESIVVDTEDPKDVVRYDCYAINFDECLFVCVVSETAGVKVRFVTACTDILLASLYTKFCKRHLGLRLLVSLFEVFGSFSPNGSSEVL